MGINLLHLNQLPLTVERCNYNELIEYATIMKLKGSTSIKYAKVYFSFLESKAIAAL